MVTEMSRSFSFFPSCHPRRPPLLQGGVRDLRKFFFSTVSQSARSCWPRFERIASLLFSAFLLLLISLFFFHPVAPFRWQPSFLNRQGSYLGTERRRGNKYCSPVPRAQRLESEPFDRPLFPFAPRPTFLSFFLALFLCFPSPEPIYIAGLFAPRCGLRSR